MRTLKLHLGVHKTASTLLQKKVALVPKEIIQKDIAIISVHQQPNAKYIDYRIQFAKLREMFEKELLSADDKESTIKELAQLIRKYLLSFKQPCLIWSDENLLGTPIGHLIGTSNIVCTKLYPASKYVAEAFKRATKDFDVSVKIYIRKQDTFIESSYKDKVFKLKNVQTFKQFLKSIELKTCYWHTVVKPWIECFEQDSVDICLFEDLSHNSENFIKKFWRWCSLAPAWLNEQNTPMTNKGFSKRQIAIANQIIPFLQGTDLEATRKFLRSLANTNDNTALFDEKQRVKFLNKYKQDNERLQEFINPEVLPLFYKHYL